MYVRGPSTQDVSALYHDTFGASHLSKSTVGRVTQQLNQEFETWRRRDLSDLPVVYLFLDGQYHAARRGTDEKEGVLSAYELLEDGRPVLLHLDLGPRESYDAWLTFLQDLVARGLRDPLLVVMDGAPGLVKAVKRVWPRAYRQRCQVHKMRNILAKLPRLMQAKMKGLVWQVFLAPTYAAAVKRGRDLIAKFKDRYPAAMECLEGDLEECHLFALSRAAPSTDPHHESSRASERRKPPAHESDPTVPTERSCSSCYTRA